MVVMGVVTGRGTLSQVSALGFVVFSQQKNRPGLSFPCVLWTVEGQPASETLVFCLWPCPCPQIYFHFSPDCFLLLCSILQIHSLFITLMSLHLRICVYGSV